MFDAVLFDLDGTLIDSESVAVRTGFAAFASVGQPIDSAFLHGLIGKDNPTASGIIRAAFPGLDIVRLNAVWSHGFQTEMQKDVPLKPFVHELLARIALPCALVTSSRRAEAHDKLARSELARYFDHVVALEDVTTPKPAPDPYLLAARLLKVVPARCLVFEDSETGAEAAHRAGCTVVQVPDIVPASGRWAHHVVPDLLQGARQAGLSLTHA
jgi:beta-phosphoglucomutase-like phosphatase (HAD superfamily)